MRGRLIVAALLILAGVDHAHALTGNDWRRLNEDGRNLYIIGVLDDWHTLQAMSLVETKTFPDRQISATEQVLGDVIKCVRERKMPYGQSVAIVEKYMTDNPGQWQLPMVRLVFGALAGACDQLK
jgi:hypothetical protein